MSEKLLISHIRCLYGDKTVVDNFSLKLDQYAIGCLLGPSGCGKTTVLRAIAGFEPVVAGKIVLDGQVLSSPTTHCPPEKRGIGMVFQDYALFPHLSVADNIAFGLNDMRLVQQKKIVAEMGELIGLEKEMTLYPHELSGGEQQRVAVARALAPVPSLLLMDEPFSSLDTDLRERLVLDIREILRQRQTTTLFVGHDQEEAFIIGEQVAVMNQGQVMQWDQPYRLYHEPANRFVADFIGQGRLVGGIVVDQQTIKTPLGLLSSQHYYDWPPDTEVDVLFRPDDILLNVKQGIDCLITDRHFKGAQIMYTLRLANGDELLSLMPSHFDIAIGERAKISADVEHLIAFKAL